MTVLSYGMANYGKDLTSVATESLIPLAHGWRDYLSCVRELLMQYPTVVPSTEKYGSMIIEYSEWWDGREDVLRESARIRRQEEQDDAAEYERSQDASSASAMPASTPPKKSEAPTTSNSPARSSSSPL